MLARRLVTFRRKSTDSYADFSWQHNDGTGILVPECLISAGCSSHHPVNLRWLLRETSTDLDQIISDHAESDPTLHSV